MGNFVDVESLLLDNTASLFLRCSYFGEDEVVADYELPGVDKFGLEHDFYLLYLGDRETILVEGDLVDANVDLVADGGIALTPID